MKILEVIPFFHPAYGGPVEVVRAITKKLVARGHDVTIYTTNAFAGSAKSRTQLEAVYENGINIYYFNDISYDIARNQHLFFSPSMLAIAKSEIKYFDIIHMQDYRNFHNIVVHHYAKKFDVPYILEPHGSLPKMVTKQWLKQLYDTFWGYRLFKDADKVIALTPAEAKQIENLNVCSDKIEILPNGIDLDEFACLPARGRFRHRYGIEDNQKILLFLGRINEIKGLDILVKAFARLIKEINDVVLVIVGPDDGYVTHLRNLISELGINGNTLLTGPIYYQEKLEVYIDSDIFILPSYYDIFGITILETCASGLPVVLTEQCGLAPWISKAKAGLIVPAGNVESLKAACCRILTDQGLQNSLREHGMQLIKECFSLRDNIGRLEDLYSSCLE